MGNTACSMIYEWGKRQLKQPSTWRGFALLATASGVSISPEQAHAIVALGATLAGAIDVFKNDEK